MAFLTRTCPNLSCQYSTPTQKRFYNYHGSFYCRWSKKRVPRYQCRNCKKCFSTSTFKKTYRQTKPYLNFPIFELYTSGTTQRRLAKVLKIDRKTVSRKLLVLSSWAKEKHLIELNKKKITQVQFDEMETFEHTRLKPVTIALAVETETHKIIDIHAAPIAYKGRFAKIAFQKYGLRKDESLKAISEVLKTVKTASSLDVEVTTDFKNSYVPVIQNEFPGGAHKQVRLERVALAQRLFHKGRRNVKDQMFAVNFVAAKIRHDLSRMARKVWVTTKKIEFLNAHLYLFVASHNRYFLNPRQLP